jgi:GH15 family glucan-1,4-alpha-glucosidase
MPLIGFLPIHDPRVQGTIARIEKELIFNGLVYRYRTEKGRGRAARAARARSWRAASGCRTCTWPWASLRKARALFKRLLALGNDLGLFAEEYDPVARRQLGNFPQAFSHIGLINSAHALESAAGGVWELADLDGNRCCTGRLRERELLGAEHRVKNRAVEHLEQMLRHLAAFIAHG